MKIKTIDASKIIDSRGEWTVEAEIELEDGVRASASVPQGKSTGAHEAKSVFADVAVKNIKTIIASELAGIDAYSQKAVDDALVALDGTVDKNKLGANAMLAVSFAVARAASASKNIPLWRHIRETAGLSGEPQKFPRLFANLINGGLHAENNLRFQEYLVIPKSGYIKESADVIHDIYEELRNILKSRFGESAINVGDEGGFSPDFRDDFEPFEILREVAAKAGLKDKIDLGLDAAAQNVRAATEELFDIYEKMSRDFGIYYIEDPFGEEDFASFAELLKIIGDKTFIVGDDLTATNPARMAIARGKKAINGVIIKPNQIGSLSEALDAVKFAREAGWAVTVSHRSGETEDDFIADFAYAVEADGIKLGAPAPKERAVKYNRLLKIEEIK